MSIIEHWSSVPRKVICGQINCVWVTWFRVPRKVICHVEFLKVYSTGSGCVVSDKMVILMTIWQHGSVVTWKKCCGLSFLFSKKKLSKSHIKLLLSIAVF